MPKPAFREDKVTQAAALLLTLNGGKMSHLKLMKLLYLAERKALLELGCPITFDSLVSMPHGPVLSRTLDLLAHHSETNGPWQKSISELDKNQVHLLDDAGVDKLSDAEEQILRSIFEQYGGMNRWQVRDFTHTLPEWQDPKNSSTRIEYRDILYHSNKTEAEIDSILDDLDNLARMEEFLD